MMHHYFVSYMTIDDNRNITYGDIGLTENIKLKANDIKKIHRFITDKLKVSEFQKVCILSINYLGEFED